MAIIYEATVTFKVTVEDDRGLTDDEIKTEIRDTVEAVKLAGYMIPIGMEVEMYTPARVTEK